MCTAGPGAERGRAGGQDENGEPTAKRSRDSAHRRLRIVAVPTPRAATADKRTLSSAAMYLTPCTGLLHSGSAEAALARKTVTTATTSVLFPAIMMVRGGDQDAAQDDCGSTDTQSTACVFRRSRVRCRCATKNGLSNAAAHRSNDASEGTQRTRASLGWKDCGTWAWTVE